MQHLKRLILKLRYFKSSFYSGSVSLKAKFIGSVRIGPNVEIGSNVVMNDKSYVNRGSVIVAAEIGRYCSIGCNVIIGAHEHPLDLLSTSPHYYLHFTDYNDVSRPVKIGDDVWIGANAVIKQGVELGDGVVVGAGSVVTRSFAPYSIVAGVPAKLMGSRLDRYKGDNLSSDFFNYLLKK